MEENESLFLPVIATRGIVLFPNNESSLEIGRKKSMIAVEISNAANDSNVLIVSQKHPEENDPKLDNLYMVGSLCKIETIKKNADKSYRILIKAIDRVKIENYYEQDGTIYGEFKVFKSEHGDSNEELALINTLVKYLQDFINGSKVITAPMLNKLTESHDGSTLSDAIAQIVPLLFTIKQELLEEKEINKRLDKLLISLNDLNTVSNIEQDIDKRLKERLDNSQKEYYLREKIKTIKEELGEDEEDDPESILDKIEKEPYPENIKKKIKDELKKLDMMQPSSPEASVIRNYIDWLINIPWYQTTSDNDDINNVEKVLNDDHYGLEKPKERILEYLAVKKLTSSLKAPIICFSGPPGTGKTSLALSIAKALNRKYVKVSLGGVSDEAEIRGHRRTYIGSMPGRIIQGMKKAGVTNPVFILDEIDKLGKDYKGDPSNALLDVLDPEQNKAFSDNFIEETYDLSNVLFIATANYLANIPAPLLDRLEVIELSSYTEQEKLEIAKQYLIKKQIEQNGVSKLDFEDESLLYLIRGYTRESGVRQLERQIGSIARKIAVKSLKNSKTSHTITKDKIVDLLGKPLFDYGKKEKKDQVGLVTGLAYTQYGGDILPIEVVYFEGKGNLIITGNLGNVMKESASIALGHVKANAKKYGIDPEIFEKIDIHIHCPEGAIPKDGPSAGCALTTALISALSSKKVRSDIAMTGEVTLRGNALPIGGLREKSIAAHRSGIKEIFIPKDNEKDIEDIPLSVRNELKINLVSHIDEIIPNVLIDESK